MSYNREMADALEQLGLDPNKHLPVEGTPVLDVSFRGMNVAAYVMPLRVAKSEHVKQRTRGQCPACRKFFALGNLGQHYFGQRKRVKGQMRSLIGCRDAH